MSAESSRPIPVAADVSSQDKRDKIKRFQALFSVREHPPSTFFKDFKRHFHATIAYGPGFVKIQSKTKTDQVAHLKIGDLKRPELSENIVYLRNNDERGAWQWIEIKPGTPSFASTLVEELQAVCWQAARVVTGASTTPAAAAAPAAPAAANPVVAAQIPAVSDAAIAAPRAEIRAVAAAVEPPASTRPTMIAPQEKECTFISVVIPKKPYWISPVYLIRGYPWRLRTMKYRDGEIKAFMRCEMSNVAELWTVNASFNFKLNGYRVSESCVFHSWEKASPEQRVLVLHKLKEGSLLIVDGIDTNHHGNKWKRRSILDPLKAHDGILVVGNEKKKIPVYKQCLASQSPFFDRLFYGEFREKDMNEIPIPDVEYEDFAIVMRMIYGCDDSLITHENVLSILQLADRFDLKIVEDGVINYLLSTNYFTNHEKLLIADTHNNRFFKDQMISRYQYYATELKELGESPQWTELSREMITAVFEA